MKVLLLHELLHIHPEGTDPNSKDFGKLRKHNVEDFGFILAKHGLNYLETEKSDLADILPDIDI